MTLTDAIREAVKRGTSVYYQDEESSIVEIFPTDRPECCIIHSYNPKEGIDSGVSPRWMPALNDFLREDWAVTDKVSMKIQLYIMQEELSRMLRVTCNELDRLENELFEEERPK